MKRATWVEKALRAWYGKVVEFLTQSEYLVTPADSSLFVKANGRKLAVMFVYVDDKEEIFWTKENL